MKQMVWMGTLIGSTVGGFVPELWGAGGFTMSSILFSAIGAAVGIYVGYKIAS